MGVVITEVGRAIIQADEPDPDPGLQVASSEPNDTPPPEQSAETAQPTASSAASLIPRAGTKQALLVDLLRGDAGVTITKLAEATGWLPHTTRAALTGLRKRGLAIVTEKIDGAMRYRITAEANRPMSCTKRVTAEVDAFMTLNLAGLREEWRRRYGPPPTFRSTDLLARLLAWRIQVDALGGLDTATVKMPRSDRVAPPPVNLAPGTRLAREWRGTCHEVDVIDGGFRHQGTVYRSLSEVARVVTGTRWNGLRFFGLRQENRP